jgi:uncharacterized membrane protein YvlD (DUF360 family)
MTDRPASRRRPILRWGDVLRAFLGLAGATVGLQLSSWIIPGFDVGGWERALVAALLVSVFSGLLRPILVWLAVRLGWVGAVLLGLFTQALAIWVVTAEESDDTSLLDSLIASWIVAAVSTLFVWLGTAGTDDAVSASLLRRARRLAAVDLSDPEVPGVVFVQADGVPFPVLDWGVRAGTLPTLSRWVRTGSHRTAEWRPKLPATTPASQMGILHGSIDGIPAFRWVDKENGRVYVANRPGDAAAIEAMYSDGDGLLADDGVSVSNLFTGDAASAYATMSAVDRTRETKQARTTLSEFLSRPAGLARSMSRMFAEIGMERFQARRARRRDIRPRVRRGWRFTMERAALNGVIRDLNTTLVAESMLRGRHSIYVDYVDYDAVAHHAGIMQPESLSALEGIDAVLAQLERVADVAPRPYHIVVLSDHGQSQGEPFADRYGEDLAALVARLAKVEAFGAELNEEASGSLNSVFASSAGPDTVLGRVLTKASDRLSTEAFERVTRAAEVEREERASRATEGAPTRDDRFIIFGSGNLGLVYVAGESRRLVQQEISDRFPALLPGLVNHPGVGFVVVDTVEFGPVALGPRGEHRVREGVVVGEDPLAGFGPQAPEFVLRAAQIPAAPDIYVNSLLDDLDEVAAFEGLVGCHGGLGGWQDRAMVVWPSQLEAPDEMIVGADAMHRVLVGWLEQLGHRRSLTTRVGPD